MSWWYSTGIYENIAIAVNGDDIEVPPKIFMTNVNPSQLSAIMNNLPNGGSNTMTALSTTDPDVYATIIGLDIGTIDLYPIFKDLAVNDTIVIYNKNVGKGYSFYFKKVSASQMSLYPTVANVRPYQLSVSMPTGATFDIGPHTGIGVIWNTDGRACPIALKMWSQQINPVQRQAFCTIQYPYLTDNTTAGYFSAAAFVVFGNRVPPPEPSTDPYNPGGTSEGTNEGTGDFDDTSDPIPIPLTSAQYSAVGAGFVNLFTLEQSQVLAFGNFLFDPTSDFTDILRIFDNVLDSVISFGILPFTPSGGSANQPIYLASVDTGATGTELASQFETVDCGSIDITEFYGGALDYAPYTNIELVLPYCGTVRLAPEEVMGKTISVEYHVDCLTGACIAFVYDGDRVLCQVPGNVLSLVPYTSGDFRQAHAALLGIVGTVGAGLVTAMTGGMTAPMLATAGASLATNVINMKGRITRGGGSAGASGYMGVQTPYIVITRPRQCLPDANGEYQGYPLYTYELLGDLSGFTKVRDIHLEGVDCTEAELVEIETLLKEGVIL